MEATEKPPVETLLERIGQLEQTVQTLTKDNAMLRKLLYERFRSGGSRFDNSSKGQLFLFGDSSELQKEESVEESPPEARPKRKKASKPTGRQPLPEGLRREPNVQPIDEAERFCTCCNPPQELKLIRYEETEILEYKPAEFLVRVDQREVRACPSGMGSVVTASLKPRVIEKGRPGVGLLTFILLSKFADHLPLHRTAKIFRRHGVPIPESTLCDWVAAAADALVPIVVAMKQWLLRQPYIQADETPAKARAPGNKKKKLKQIYFFACSLPWQEVVFEYSIDRKAASLSAFLDGFTGDVIQVDEYAGYDEFFRQNEALRRAGCWAHVIRKFKSAIESADRASSARDICHIIAVLERIETLMRSKGRCTEQRLAVRQRIHVGAINKIWDLVDEGLADASIEPQSVYGKAIRYVHNHRGSLTTFLEDGRVEMDNNGIEHSNRPIAIGRKNWLRIGHIDAGDRAAVMYSLLASCARMGIDPREYLHDVLERIPAHPINQVHELTPRNWRAARAAGGDHTP